MEINFQKIEKLIKEYYILENGFHIKSHNELILISINPSAYISRKALKHFVERRYPELRKNHGEEESLQILILMVFSVCDVMGTPDTLRFQEGKAVYEKVLDLESSLSLRVVTELLLDKWQVKSIHPVKTKIPP